MAGNWEHAARYAEECHETMAQTGQEEERPYILAIGALVSAHLGLVEATRSATDEGLPLALRLGVLPAYFELLAIRGFLELSLGNAAEAHRFLGPLPEAVREAGFGEPLFRFHGDAIETLLALGQTEKATVLLAELEEQGTALQRVWALAIASRCRALLSAAGGEIDRAADTELEHDTRAPRATSASRSSADAHFSSSGTSPAPRPQEASGPGVTRQLHSRYSTSWAPACGRIRRGRSSLGSAAGRPRREP